MRPYLFVRARELIRKGLIRKTAETPRAVYFVAQNEKGKEFNIEICYENRPDGNSIFSWKCDCDFMGIQGVPNKTICSHIIAAFIIMGLDIWIETFRYFLRKRHGA
jgi:hypothetical protein